MVRVGLYSGAAPDVDQGWSLFLLEEFGFAGITLSSSEIKKDNLCKNFDVIVFTDQSAERLQRLLIDPLDSERHSLDGLRHFVERGGTLLLLNRACDLVLRHWDLGVKNAVANLKADEYFVPGSLLRLLVDTGHPLGYGLQRHLCGLVQHSPAFAVAPGLAESVAIYAGGNILESGLLVGEKYLALQSAVVSAPLGSGRAVLMGLRPQFRAQTRATYKLFFNTLLLSGAQPVSLF